MEASLRGTDHWLGQGRDLVKYSGGHAVVGAAQLVQRAPDLGGGGLGRREQLGPELRIVQADASLLRDEARLREDVALGLA